MGRHFSHRSIRYIFFSISTRVSFDQMESIRPMCSGTRVCTHSRNRETNRTFSNREALYLCWWTCSPCPSVRRGRKSDVLVSLQDGQALSSEGRGIIIIQVFRDLRKEDHTKQPVESGRTNRRHTRQGLIKVLQITRLGDYVHEHLDFRVRHGDTWVSASRQQKNQMIELGFVSFVVANGRCIFPYTKTEKGGQEGGPPS